ncbi:MAG TPA: BlaI/MecI/CopY family transcriptional regulator [Streptosporangiaceae bacterium]|nr:BlaI/MecI/CopY family transcriptional regulator [Streptosporangiaceae bacterium]
MAEQPGARSVLGPLEADVMGALWRAGEPLLVKDVVEKLNTGRPAALAYTTVMTVMSRLAAKGILTRSRSGRRFVYAPVAADAAEIAVRGVLAEFGDAALARFVERAELDPQLRERLRRLMEQSS